MDATLESAMRAISARLGGSPARKDKTQSYVRRFPRVLAFCDVCGKVHTFAHHGRKLTGYGCGSRKNAE